MISQVFNVYINKSDYRPPQVYTVDTGLGNIRCLYLLVYDRHSKCIWCYTCTSEIITWTSQKIIEVHMAELYQPLLYQTGNYLYQTGSSQLNFC